MKTDSILNEIDIVIKGAGEMASGIVVRLYRAGFRRMVMLEVPQPMAVRRLVSFCEAVHDGTQNVEDVVAVLAKNREDIQKAWKAGQIPVCVDPEWKTLPAMAPRVSVDAVLAKRNLGTRKDEAQVVIALGPGFTAGVDAHYVIETNRGHDLGRVLTTGSAQPNTGVPGIIGGHGIERVLRAPVAGQVEACAAIGEEVKAGDILCSVGGVAVKARINGVIRGMIRQGVFVKQGVKLGDVDPRGDKGNCFTVSEKARALGGAVLEAICANL